MADASRDASAKVVEGEFPSVRVIREVPGTLTPLLWARGLELSSGRVVAFTTGQCVVPPGWARALLDGIARGFVGVGGALDLDRDASSTDAAVFYLRYSSFLAFQENEMRLVREIPGDNAAYRCADLRRHQASFVHGFWEVDFHRRVHAEGLSLAMSPRATARFGGDISFRVIVRHRLAHGRHSGALRVATGARTAWQVILAAPLVPIVLVTRIARRVWRRPAHRHRFTGALPVLFALASAWAAGEAWGAIAGDGHSNARGDLA